MNGQRLAGSDERLLADGDEIRFAGRTYLYRREAELRLAANSFSGILKEEQAGFPAEDMKENGQPGRMLGLK